MARTTQQVEQDLVAYIQEQDPTATYTYGPVRDLLLAPVAPQISAIEQQIGALSLAYMVKDSGGLTPSQLAGLLAQWGTGVGTGLLSRAVQMFSVAARPATPLVIPSGTVVSTADGRYAYRTLTTVVLNAANANAYYNPSTRRYQIATIVEAVATGVQYDVAKGRIVALVSELEGVDSTVNVTAAVGGSESEDSSHALARLQLKILGNSNGTLGGLLSGLADLAPTLITDLTALQSTDPNFARPVFRPAVDVYVSGADPQAYQQSYTANGGEDVVVLDRQPVSAITSVALNSQYTLANWRLKRDTGIYRDSALAQDSLVLDPQELTSLIGTPYLRTGDVLAIGMVYDNLLWSLQQQVGTQPPLFQTSTLVRGAEELPVDLSIRIVAGGNVDASQLARTARQACEKLVSSGVFIGAVGVLLTPESVVNALTTTLPGVKGVDVLKLMPTEGPGPSVQSIAPKPQQLLALRNLTIAGLG